MNEPKSPENTAAAETGKQTRPLDDAEAAKIVGGSYTQEQYDTWQRQLEQGQGQGEGFGE